MSLHCTVTVPVMTEEFKQIVRAELKEFRKTFDRDVRNELREIKNSLSFMNKTYEEIKDQMARVLSENQDLRKSNERLEKTCGDQAKQIKILDSRVLHCEQYSRNCNIELKGVPTQASENIMGLLGKIGEKIGEPIAPADVEITHRVPIPNSSEKNIVVQFVRRAKRNAVLEKARRNRVKANDLGFAQSTSVYVNEHLCPELKKLLGQAVTKKKDASWKFVWVRNAQIFARKSETSPVVKIACPDDLAKISAL